jgi:hypothetical protein
VDRLRSSANFYAYSSLNTYNLWGVYGFWKPDDANLGLGLTPRSAGWLLFIAGLVYGVWLLVRSLRTARTEPPGLLTLSLFATYFPLLFVMTMTRMHERYLYPVLPFLLLLAGVCWLEASRQERGEAPATRRFLGVPLVLYAALTALHTMNLYHVYQYYTQPEPGRVPPANTLFWGIYNNAPAWSALSMLCFIAFATFMTYWLPPRETGETATVAAGSPTAPSSPQPATAGG